jgi:Integron cassette protein VCH_CASS1 chain
MSIKIDSIGILKKYFDGVLGRADHHAQEVEEVALTLMGAVIWKSKEDTIEVRSVGEKTGNMLWFETDNGRYAFRYEHSNQTIELRNGNSNGPIIRTFNNQVNAGEVYTTFATL